MAPSAPAPVPAPDPSEILEGAYARYDALLARAVASKLVKPKIGQEHDSLVQQAIETLTNPPAIDRRLKEIAEGPRRVLMLLAATQQTRWRTGAIYELAHASAADDASMVLKQLLESGLVYPLGTGSIATFDQWFTQVGLLGEIYIPPPVLLRARRLRGKPPEGTRPGVPATVDGYDWPLRIAAVWQMVRAAPVRMTQANT
ncbi:MAG: hypothetical protein ACRCZF_18565, partial [Gemmataceae bacterium]